MKIIFSLFISVVLFTSPANLFAQSGETTYILLRHAEKDASPLANKADVNLSADGQKRALRFFETMKKYNPDQIFSSIFLRARATVTPLAENLNPKYRLMIQYYDHTDIPELAEKLLKSNAKTVVVAGHNTTTPELANLLIKQEKYKPLAESEYDKIFIIKIRKHNGKPNEVIEEKVITY